MKALIPALHSEYRKLISTRSWWLLLITMAGYMAFMAGVMGIATGSAGTSPEAAEQNPLGTIPVVDATVAVYTIAVAAGYVFPVIVGALSVTGEFRHRTITPTFLAEPNRTRVLAAKMLAALPVGALYGVVGVLAGVGAGAGALAVTGHPTMLGDSEVLTALARAVLALTLWALVGVGVGVALPNQVAVVVVILAFTQFLEPVLRTVLSVTGGGSAQWLAQYFPGAAGEAIVGPSLYSAMGAATLAHWWQGALVLGAYAVVFAVLGRLTTFRRDIT